jgi:hypothetical protein
VTKVVARPWRDTFLELKRYMARSAALTLGTLAHFRHFRHFSLFILALHAIDHTNRVS